MTRPGRSAAGSLLLALVSVVASLLLLEIGFRVAARVRGRQTLEAAASRASALPPGGDARLGDLVRPSRLRDVVYELVPQLQVRFLGAPLSTSRAGFRDREYATAKAPGTQRILGIGDSLMFGWGVADGQDYLSLVEKRLTNEGRPVEILNLAVPGYNTVMEVATLREKGLAYAPDLVVVGVCGNDAGLPYFLLEPPELLALDRSFVADFVRSRLAGEAVEDEGGSLVLRPRGAGRRFVARGDTARVPKRYAHMAGLPAFSAALEELRELATSHRFEVLVLYYPGAPTEMREVVDALGLPSLNTAGAIRRFARKHGGYAKAVPRLRLGPRDPHPSADGHRLIAGVLAAHLEAAAAR